MRISIDNVVLLEPAAGAWGRLGVLSTTPCVQILFCKGAVAFFKFLKNLKFLKIP